jgi:Domain of unknown function (DUF4281)
LIRHYPDIVKIEAAMTPDILFQYSGPIAVLGWLALAVSPLAPRIADILAAVAIPALLSVAYTGLILVNWSTAPGGFDSLDNVMALFTRPALALAGWVHYLAFDLFVGAWITRTARAEHIAHLFVLPCLVLTFLFGPAGFLAFTALRASFAARARMTGAFA